MIPINLACRVVTIENIYVHATSTHPTKSNPPIPISYVPANIIAQSVIQRANLSDKRKTQRG